MQELSNVTKNAAFRNIWERLEANICGMSILMSTCTGIIECGMQGARGTYSGIESVQYCCVFKLFLSLLQWAMQSPVGTILG